PEGYGSRAGVNRVVGAPERLVADEGTIRDGEGAVGVIESSAAGETVRAIAAAGDGLVPDESTVGDRGGRPRVIASGCARCVVVADALVVDEQAVHDREGGARKIADSPGLGAGPGRTAGAGNGAR